MLVDRLLLTNPRSTAATMLISPIRVYDLLKGLLEPDEDKGPHTALLITPSGQLLSQAVLPEEDVDEEREANGDAGEAAGEVEEEEGEEVDDEPWLEGPERLRLLLGLASQWEEDESPRVECEVGIVKSPSYPPARAAVPAPDRAPRARSAASQRCIATDQSTRRILFRSGS